MRSSAKIFIFTCLYSIFFDYAFASEKPCPDIPRATYSLVERSNSDKTDIQTDNWIIPLNLNRGSFNARKSFPSIISRYTDITKPLFTCSKDWIKYKVSCITQDGRSFSSALGRRVVIPNKSGGFTKIQTSRVETYNRVSCKSRTYEDYNMYYLIEDLPGADIHHSKRLPYLLIDRENESIQITNHGDAPKF